MNFKDEPRCKVCGQMKLDHTEGLLLCRGFKTKYEPAQPVKLRRAERKALDNELPLSEDVHILPAPEIPSQVWEALKEFHEECETMSGV